jgi:probable F420-dependent oxidoreductase
VHRLSRDDPPPFRFSVASAGAPSLDAWRELARVAEGLGYHALLLSDHMRQPLSPLPALVTAADATTTLRVGTYVLCQDLHNPVVLAKQLATVDVLTEGRLDVGIGAGWLEEDYAAAGLTLDPGPIRLARFRESFAIVRGFLSEPIFSFSGRFFEVPELECTPRPVQQPHPPLMVGAGRRRMLEFAAREADVVSITPGIATSGGGIDGDVAGRLDEKVAWVRATAAQRATPPRLDQVLWECMVTPRPEPVLDMLAAALRVSPEGVAALPFVLIGTSEQVAETLIERRERWGFSVVAVPEEALRAFAPVVERLAAS